MRKITFFMLISVDGFFEGVNHDISWHNAGDSEFNTFALEQNQKTGTFLFGKRTYELMKSWWPTDEAKASDPEVSKMMNETPKIVVSNSIKESNWENTSFINQDVIGEIRKLKEEDGKDIMIFGSNELTVSLMRENLVDEFRIMVNPLVLGDGTKLFSGLTEKYNLKLVGVRNFENGNILFDYIPKL